MKGFEISERVEISKADWKLFCERVSDWQEQYMDELDDFSEDCLMQ